MKKRILFVNDEMCVGGVSKVLNNLLRQMNHEMYEVELLILHYHGEMLDSIPKNIKVLKGSDFFSVVDEPFSDLVKHKKWSKIYNKIKMYIWIKSGLIKKKVASERRQMSMSTYDVEIAFKEGFCSIFVASGNSKIKINWIHADYKVMNYAQNYMNVMPRILNDFNYHVAVSKVAADSFEEVFNLNTKVKVIHNIIEDDNIISKANEIVEYRDDKFTFISVGRLHAQKSYDRLINVCSQLKKEGLIFKLYIIGDGELKQYLENIIAELELVDFVFLLGNKQNPYKYLHQADCFVLSSKYEGLPTVVYESLILKVPVIALRVAGVDEQLMDLYGKVVNNDKEELYKVMKEVLVNPDMLSQFRLNLVNYTYDNKEITREICKLFGD